MAEKWKPVTHVVTPLPEFDVPLRPDPAAELLRTVAEWEPPAPEVTPLRRLLARLLRGRG